MKDGRAYFQTWEAAIRFVRFLVPADMDLYMDVDDGDWFYGETVEVSYPQLVVGGYKVEWVVY